MPDDRYARFDYSRLIAWDERLNREWPLFEELFAKAPSNRILDLGSGTGEHARFLASKGFDVTGVDSSPAMLEKAAPAMTRASAFSPATCATFRRSSTLRSARPSVSATSFRTSTAKRTWRVSPRAYAASFFPARRSCCR